MIYSPKLELDALIFARNDALIDTSQSCPQTVIETVETYLTQAVGLSPASQPLLTPAEVITLYASAGFASYRDVTTALLIYFIEMLPPVPSPTFPAKFHVPAILAYLQIASRGVQTNLEELQTRKNIEALIGQITAAGGGLTGASTALPNVNRHLLVADGPITGINLAGRIYQEIYLGADLFQQIYNQPAIISRGTGYMHRETMRLNPAILAALSKHLSLGLVSTGTRPELAHTLHTHQLEDYFQISLSPPPHPLPASWLLLETARQLTPLPTRYGYIGATVADIQAARSATQTTPCMAIGVLPALGHKETIRQALAQVGANIIIGHPDHLKELLFG